MAFHAIVFYYKLVQLLATDVLVSASMTNAANCDYSCELQSSVNHQTFERILRHPALRCTDVHIPFSFIYISHNHVLGVRLLITCSLWLMSVHTVFQCVTWNAYAWTLNEKFYFLGVQHFSSASHWSMLCLCFYFRKEGCWFILGFLRRARECEGLVT